MKHYELRQCALFLNKFSFINSITRVEDNTLKIDLDGKITIYANLKRGASRLFMCEGYMFKKYKAPFDIALLKRFTNANIKRLEAFPDDKVLSLEVSQSGSYKVINSTLFLEFTGKNTNAIILDEEGVVVEALRHIDQDISYRVVKVGEKLAALPPYTIKENPQPIGDTELFLRNAYKVAQESELQNIKMGKLSSLQKKIAKLQVLLAALPSDEELLRSAKEAKDKAALLLANRHLLKSYEKVHEFEDCEGKKHKIAVEGEAKDASTAIDELFNRSKKLKQRAKSSYIEKQNLSDKLEFLERLSNALLGAKSREEVEILLPKTTSNAKKEEQNSSFSSFFVEGYKVMVGKNEKGNAELLKNAKKNDIWFHLKDAPSSHVILKTDKSGVGESVLAFCAKLCVNFSSATKGTHLVDYCPRRNVKIVQGAHVNYVDFKTMGVEKE